MTAFEVTTAVVGAPTAPAFTPAAPAHGPAAPARPGRIGRHTSRFAPS